MENLRKELINNYFGNDDIKDYFDYQKHLSKIAFKLSLEEQLALFPFLKIDDNKLIVISDTYYGSVYENYDYINMLYEFAIKNNYKNILHGGDFIQGDIPPTNEGLEKISSQTLGVINNYPYDHNIKNYILLGNHDHLIYKNMESSLSMLSLRNDFNLLGIRYAYINWYNHLISISHQVKKRKYKLDFPRAESLVNFHGHRHELHIIESHVFLPTLSDDIKRYDQRPNYPGFLTSEIDGEELNINSYIIEDNKIVNKGLVLKRNSNERVKIK